MNFIRAMLDHYRRTLTAFGQAVVPAATALALSATMLIASACILKSDVPLIPAMVLASVFAIVIVNLDR